MKNLPYVLNYILPFDHYLHTYISEKGAFSFNIEDILLLHYIRLVSKGLCKSQDISEETKAGFSVEWNSLGNASYS